MEIARSCKLSVLVLIIAFVKQSQGGCNEATSRRPTQFPVPCPDSQLEIKREQNKADGKWTVYCCDKSDTKGFDYYDKQAQSCQVQKCVSNDPGNRCETLKVNTYYKGRLFKYIQVGSDQCKLDNGKIGSVALCCPADSTDTVLSTLHGAENQEFPHFVRVGKYGCGGTVYNDRWIITAAHCVTNWDTGKLRSVAADGQHEFDDCCNQVSINLEVKDSTNIENNVHVYKVEKMVVHPKSSYLTPQPNGPQSRYDMAMLKVDRPIKFSDQVKALRIPDTDYDPLEHGDRAMILGFGKTDTGLNSQKLLKANVKIWRKDEVNINPGKETLEQIMWVGGINNGIVMAGSGTGDSGGPAVCKGPQGTAVLCGVTSFVVAQEEACKRTLNDHDCGPSAYNNVSYFSSWIKQTAGEQTNVQFYDQPIFGEEVGKKEYLAHVHITDAKGGKCGGTLVADDVVLTAASCVVDEATGDAKQGLKVTYKLRDLKNGGGETVDVYAVGQIPGFTRAKRDTIERKLVKRIVSYPLERFKVNRLDKSQYMREPFYENNLAYVKLKKGTGLGKKIAKIATKSPKQDDIAMEVAFPDRPSGTANSGKIPLSKRQFQMLDRSTCQKRLDRLDSVIGKSIHLSDFVMCGVEKYSGGSSCDRELGGGLYCNEGGKEVLCGVQVFRMCQFNVPNAFYDLGLDSATITSNIENFKNVEVK